MTSSSKYFHVRRLAKKRPCGFTGRFLVKRFQVLNRPTCISLINHQKMPRFPKAKTAKPAIPAYERTEAAA